MWLDGFGQGPEKVEDLLLGVGNFGVVDFEAKILIIIKIVESRSVVVDIGIVSNG